MKLFLLELNLVAVLLRHSIVLILDLVVVVTGHEGLIRREVGLILVVGFGKRGFDGFESRSSEGRWR